MNTLTIRRFIVSSDVLFQEVSGEVVLLDLASERYFGLDAIGTRVWQHIDKGTQWDDALEQIMEEYDVSREQLEMDVEALVAQLLQAGLLTLESPTG